MSGYPVRFGSYILLGTLARGGMGQVFLALTGARGLETLCILKRVIPEAKNRPDLVRRFKDEANLVRQLKHPSLVATHAVAEIEGELCIVQEFLDGHDLEDVANQAEKRRQPIPVPLAAHIVREVARAMRYAHDNNVVHRDINPLNVRLTYAGQVKLLDFGLALSALKTEQTMEGQWGKPTYMAPEQLAGAKADARSDVYALGVVLWELLTGELHISPTGPRAPSAVNPAVPEALDQVVARSAAPGSDDRYETAAALEDALTPFVPESPETALAAYLASLYDVDRERAVREQLVARAGDLVETELPPTAWYRKPVVLAAVGGTVLLGLGLASALNGRRSRERGAPVSTPVAAPIAPPTGPSPSPHGGQVGEVDPPPVREGRLPTAPVATPLEAPPAGPVASQPPRRAQQRAQQLMAAASRIVEQPDPDRRGLMGALQLALQAVRLQPYSADAHILTATVAQRLGRRRLALSSLKRAIALKPADQNLRRAYAEEAATPALADPTRPE